MGHNILILGSSYGLLPGIKLALAGHVVTFVGKEAEVAAMAAAPLRLSLPLRHGQGHASLIATPAPQSAPGQPTFRVPDQVDPAAFDLALLAMQEPHYAAPEVARLIAAIGAARLPCLSIMNLPPAPFLKRLGSIPEAALAGVYSSGTVWQALDPDLLSVASPDPQAVRLDPAKQPGALTVTLPSNFKAAPFGQPAAQQVLEQIARDMSHLKTRHDGADIRLPIALRAHGSVFVPLAKWPMLIAGNFRCITDAAPRSIAAAVHNDPAQSRAIFEAVYALARDLGARDTDLVGFEAYGQAAAQLSQPSSPARALASGAIAIERIDRLVQNLMADRGTPHPAIDAIVSRVDRLLEKNKKSVLSSVDGALSKQ